MMLMNAGKSLMMNFDDKIKDLHEALANQMY
jgi:hypothetical protein